MKKALEVTKKQLRKVTTRETPNKGIVAGKIGPSGRYSVTKGTFRASSSEEKAHLPFESELKEKSDTTSKETNTQLGAAETDNSPVENARVTTKKTAFGVTRRYNTGAQDTPQVTKLKASQEKQKSRIGSPSEQLGKSNNGDTQKTGNNLRTSIRADQKKKVLQEKVEQKIPDDEEAVPQKGRIRSIEENLSAAASSSNLSRHSTSGDLSKIGKHGEESKKQEEKPDSHCDSDSGVDLSGSNSEQNSESTINTSVSSGSAEHVEEIADSFNPLIEKYSSEVSKLNEAKSGILHTTQKPRTRSISFSSSTESLNSILSAAEEDDTMQSDGEDKLNEGKSPILQAEQEPEVQEDPIQFEQIGPIRTEQEPINEITPIKKQPSDRNPNVTLAICCLAACCFIAAADKESGMLFLAGITFLIAAIVIEWQTPPPSRELTYPSSSPFIDDKAMAKT